MMQLFLFRTPIGDRSLDLAPSLPYGAAHDSDTCSVAVSSASDSPH